MFSKNNKVSGRQLGRMIFVETSGSTAFLSLSFIGKYGSDGLFIILWLYIFALIFSMGMLRLAKNHKNCEQGKFGKIIKTVLMIVLLAKYVCMVGIVLYGIADVAKLVLIPEVSTLFILILTFVCVIYCIDGGIESRGRACELLFFVVLIPIVIICVMLIPKIQPHYIVPEFEMNLKNAVLDFLALAWFFVPAESLFLIRDCYDNNNETRTNIYAGITLSFLVNFAIFAGALGVYGGKTVSGMDRPVLRLMQISGLPGGFLNRQDGIMSVFLIVSLFCSAWALTYHINELIKNIFLQKNTMKYAMKITVTAMVMVLFILYICSDKSKEKIISANVGGMDLEERKFVMSMIVSYSDDGTEFYYEIASSGNGGGGESAQGNDSSAGNVSSEFEVTKAKTAKEAEEKISYATGSKLDYSHMKVLLLDKELMEDNEKLKGLIEEISGNVKIAENVVVCGIELDYEFEPSEEYGKKTEQITKQQFENSEIYRFNRIYSEEDEKVTIPLIDEKVKIVGSGMVTKDVVYWDVG
ncbi:MAG: GerAB/ArcD/ProY family transporter [Lachnospiraceae bacterium]|nr:GerAB/ArcD/ProY family transporter [Lachnospiraceae bacterium]